MVPEFWYRHGKILLKKNFIKNPDFWSEYFKQDISLLTQYTLLNLNNVDIFVFHICRTRDLDVEKYGFRNAKKRCVKKIRQTCKPQDRRTVQKFEGVSSAQL